MLAFLMLKHNEPYRYARPERMAEKFTEFRDKYVPVEQRAQKPPLRTSAKRGLGAVYQLAGLPSTPSPAELPAGEQRMLAKLKLAKFVQDLHQPASAGKAASTRTRKRK